MSDKRPIDVLTLGETMVRLVPKGFTRLEEAQELECRTGGSESNVAVALARLEAKARGCSTSFDVNYRARLWSAEAAREALDPLLADVDLLITPLADAQLLWDLPADGEATAAALRERFGAKVVAVTLGAEGALCHDGQVRSAA